ncbi:replicative DNA helicase [Mycoplasmopsis alligatoris]|uniref:Replicative DNA helicase n=1 Tax=Mycoplasmopsis alligatoris A21JP2 TaxID=747682 RepID=D4XUZ2_9BACT|nr:replicative DNA helicase [Mycoplasmopsis alligatoris]EFF41814.1 replicative DNA helicase [Mycoplasmopsis alligatoris A21JP2]
MEKTNNNFAPTIHQNQNIESSVLGLALSNHEIQQEMVTYISEQEFYTNENRELFKIISILVTKLGAVNIDEIAGYLHQNTNDFYYLNNEMINSFLNKVILSAGYAKNRINYYRELTNLSSLRLIESKLKQFEHYLKENKKLDSGDVIRKLEVDLTHVNNKREIKEYEDSRKVSNEYFTDLLNRSQLHDSQLAGIASGFPVLDNLTQGFKGGELIILAARPAMGKTAFALNIATYAAANNKNVAFVSLEMSSVQLMGRIYSCISGIPGEKFKKASLLNELDWENVKNTKYQVDELKLFLDDSTTSHLDEITWKVGRLHQQNKLDMLVIDYLQLITSPGIKGENRQNEVSKISRTLKQLAREFNIPVVALSQLSRGVEQREDKRPLMSDLRESGSIEQDADMVLFLYRDEYYKKMKKGSSTLSSDREPGSEICELIISKHRNGPTGKINLGINLSASKFIHIDQDKVYEHDN